MPAKKNGAVVDSVSAGKRKIDNAKETEKENAAVSELIDLFVDAPLTDGEEEESGNEHTSDSENDLTANGNAESSDDESSEYSDSDEEEEDDDDSDVETSEDEATNVDDEKTNKGETVLNGNSESLENGKLDDGPSTSSVFKPDEYEIDSSDEEDVRNTIGNVPVEWYKDYPHIGYDWKGKKILKPATGDELDKFLKRMDDPEFWKTVKDKATGQDVVLSEEDLEILRKIQQGKLPGRDTMNEEFENGYIRDTIDTSLEKQRPSKRSFIPSLFEKEKVSKIVHAIKMGWITTKPECLREDASEIPLEEQEETFYALWDKLEEDPLTKSQKARKNNHVSAPKLTLPGHAESYNPPPEYLLTEEEKQKRREQDFEDRQLNFVPKKYDAMRLIPGYYRFVKERFERCLDLYLCPRQRKMKVNVDPEDLIPKLPRPKDLQPFPSMEAIVFRGHTGIVRSISPHLDGQFIASGSDDGTVRVWEVTTGRCFRIYTLKDPVLAITWLPKNDVCLLVVASGKDVWFINPEVGDKLAVSNTDHLLNNLPSPDSSSPVASFSKVTEVEQKKGFRLKLSHTQNVKRISWHPKGDYFATICGEGSMSQVVMHQLSKLRSQSPFKKLSMIESVLFHPLKPFFFVSTQRSVRIYDLSKQELKKTLLPSCKFISSAALHPGGDNVIVGSYDSKLCWFDLDSSVRPYQTLRNHNKAIRQVAFHRKYPLFASCSDDGSVIVCHGMVYSDFNQFPLIVPVKQLKNHGTDKDSSLGVLDVQFHPTQPWIFSAGADKTIRLFV